jgi:hypothetical protein
VIILKIESILFLVLVIGILSIVINEINKNNLSIIMDKIDQLSNKITDKNINAVTGNIIINKEPIGFKPY